MSALGPIATFRSCWLVFAVCAGCTGAISDADEDFGVPDDDEPVSEGEDASSVVVEDHLIAAGGFRHPGVLLNGAQLEFLRGKIRANEEPWKGAHDKAKASKYAAYTWTAKPREIVNCGANSTPNEGCSDEFQDACAAYTQALLGAIDQDDKRFDKAIEIMGAWARTITSHVGRNTPLQTGWAGVMFAAAGELVEHTSKAWSAADRDQFKKMLRTVHLPIVIKGKGGGTNGNWELIMTEALINIAVFLDDEAAFDKAAALWRKRVPAYIYMKTDGPLPVAPNGSITGEEAIIKFWKGQTTFVDGLAQETCRDFGHTEWGIAAAVATAETALQQGVDLYRDNAARLRAALEFHAEYILGKPAPSWLCGGKIKLGQVPSWEIAFNHFHTRHGHEMPFSERYVLERVRRASTPVNRFIAWETLTHAGVGKVGLEER